MKSQVTITLLVCLGLSALVCGDPVGNGDVNGDGKINVADAVYLLNLQFLGGPEPVPLVCPTDEEDDGTGIEVEFDEAEVFLEYNSTDLDLGIHIFFDAEEPSSERL